MITVQLHLDALSDRINVATRLVDETHPGGGGWGRSPARREA